MNDPRIKTTIAAGLRSGRPVQATPSVEMIKPDDFWSFDARARAEVLAGTSVGLPQCGQVGAMSETTPLQSGHEIKATVSPSRIGLTNVFGEEHEGVGAAVPFGPQSKTFEPTHARMILATPRETERTLQGGFTNALASAVYGLLRYLLLIARSAKSN
jgi:hypothetical protein